MKTARSISTESARSLPRALRHRPPRAPFPPCASTCSRSVGAAFASKIGAAANPSQPRCSRSSSRSGISEPHRDLRTATASRERPWPGSDWPGRVNLPSSRSDRAAGSRSTGSGRPLLPPTCRTPCPSACLPARSTCKVNTASPWAPASGFRFSCRSCSCVNSASHRSRAMRPTPGYGCLSSRSRTPRCCSASGPSPSANWKRWARSSPCGASLTAS